MSTPVAPHPGPAPHPFELVSVPDEGRVFRARRRVRLGDVGASGRLRLDALARYLQDVSNDDTRDAALPDGWGWLVRRTTVVVHRFPRLDDEVDLATFCSGTGPRWAERRVQVATDGTALVDAATLWVHVDPQTGSARGLPDVFHEIYTPTAQGRRVSARITHPAPPPGDERTDERTGERAGGPAGDVSRRPWPIRAADLDALGHVNNAVSWAAVEEVLADRARADSNRADEAVAAAPVAAELGFHLPLEYGDDVELVVRDHGTGGADLWLVGPDGVRTSGIVRPA